MDNKDAIIYKPELLLENYVDHITTKAFQSDSEDYQLVVPDGMTELVINFGSCYNRVDKTRNNEFTIKGSHVIGPKSTYCFVKPSSVMDVITVRFKIGALKNFTKIPQQLLVDNVVDAYEIFGKDIEILEHELFQNNDIKIRISLISEFLLSRMRIQKESIFDKLIKEILVSVINTELKINKLFKDINYKTLERMFADNMGVTPKKTMGILQFNYATFLCSHNNNLSQIAYDSGYFDQAHYIKSFRHYCGVTPKMYSKFNDKMFKLNQDRINAQFERLR